MSAVPLAPACQLDDLKQLDNKPYIKFQTHLLNHVLDELPRTLAVLYEKLYIKQKTDKRHVHGVVMSQRQISKLIRRHESTAYRQLKQLESLGYVRKTLNKYSKNLYRNQLCYEVVAPEEILFGIKNNVLDLTDNNILYKRSPAKMHEDPCKNAGHINNSRNAKTYIKTNIREKSTLDNLEPVFEAVVLPGIPSTISSETSSVEVEPIATVAETQDENFKPQSEVAGFITKDERKEITTKLKAMKRDREIHPKVQENYQDILILINHVIVHCMYRNVFKKTFKHALRSAAVGIRNGTWTTPKRVLAAETVERERLANEAKERERQECLESKGSGMWQKFGEMLRLSQGPTNADIARETADILERGMQELGQSPKPEYAKMLKDILKKSIEQKGEERRK